MAIIRFTQCDSSFKECELCHEASYLPIYPRLEFYKTILSESPDDEYSTFDEHLILVAQWMKRNKKLQHLQFVSICENSNDQIMIETDDIGDMLDDPHYGCFTSRLQYLR